ncbi:Hypothetical predicted protein [Mytilus galloprovincialis]|uniref:Endonuclease/exonuclease/phosphatase domain-containing protein n=1 Tax=Mytilus galloprovincialis TaxID=29158 RepID=A0A8B6H229_MYTGA|nr:Hypothetical predicted protein [Mytilus galloprovincialis]
MLNGRFNDSDFTCISGSGRSVVDYICVPYEDTESILDFKIMSMSDLIAEIGYVPEKIPDHSLLYCDIHVPMCDAKYNEKSDHAFNQRRKYKVSDIPNDFLKTEEIASKVHETIRNIENSMRITKDVQNAYDNFQSLIICEMNNRLPSINYSNGNMKQKKSLYKPYWNETLSRQWDQACIAEKKWLKSKGSNSAKRYLKEAFCAERKAFDRINRKFKRRYQQEERQKLEDKLTPRINVTFGDR